MPDYDDPGWYLARGMRPPEHLLYPNPDVYNVYMPPQIRQVRPENMPPGLIYYSGHGDPRLNTPTTPAEFLKQVDDIEAALEHEYLCSYHHSYPLDFEREAFKELWAALSDQQKVEYAGFAGPNPLRDYVGPGRGFYCISNTGRDYYVSCHALVGNVLAVTPDKRPAVNFCAYPKDGGPMATGWLIQKLAVENDEDYWLMTARWSGNLPEPVHPPRTPKPPIRSASWYSLQDELHALNRCR